MSRGRTLSDGRKRMLWIAAGLCALGIAERGARDLVSRHLLPTHGAAWIWAPDSLERSDGLAFYAVRDFELDALPSDVRLHILADEEYVAYLNGRRIGSGVYYSGADLDSFSVRPLLEPGRNRLAVELRSDRGGGGLLLSLIDGLEGDRILGSDRDWRIYENADGILEGARLDGGVAAIEWQVPPTGAWGAPAIGQIRRGFASSTAGRDPRPALARTPIRQAPRAAGVSGRKGVLFDFGEPVTGYLQLAGLEPGPRRFLVSFGDDPHEGRDGLRVRRVPGQDFWVQAETGTFRFVRLWGAVPARLEVTVQGVSRDVADVDAARKAEREQGVFGLPGPVEPSL